MKTRMMAMSAAALVIGAGTLTTMTVYAGGQAHRERHPEMTAALRALERSKNSLEKAKHDYDGHRAKALDLVKQAIDEVKAGIASDKK